MNTKNRTKITNYVIQRFENDSNVWIIKWSDLQNNILKNILLNNRDNINNLLKF